jgi:3D (Asp-Asp-Asp) domain-containing protein
MTRALVILLLALPLASAEPQVYEVTAYCPCRVCCGKWSGGPTASGKMPKQGVTCAAPRRIPFGTRLWIEGVGVRVVQDRLSPKFDSRIDVFFRTHAEAKKFGKRMLKVRMMQ